jgi:acyl dehydratase
MLYAIGVGAGLGEPGQELDLTTENSGGLTLKTLPSFLTILTTGAMPPALHTLDTGRFLHAEQRIEIVRPLPAAGGALLSSTIAAVFDKGSGAIVSNVSTLRSAEDGVVIGRGYMNIFVRGAGGFDAPHGTAPAQPLPDRTPDARIVHHTRVEQALLYRLSGDRHRLHSDPEFARERGFAGPIMHGLCTYGFACRALVAGIAGGDPTRLRMMDGRFRKPVYPGDTLTTEMWRMDDGNVHFRTLDSAGDAVIERGQAAIAG